MPDVSVNKAMTGYMNIVCFFPNNLYQSLTFTSPAMNFCNTKGAIYQI